MRIKMKQERFGIQIGYKFTGGEIDITEPEEQVRQAYIKKLVKVYGYNLQQIKINVPILMGSEKRFCDIAVYDKGNIVGIVETKAHRTKLKEKHKGQLESYMSATPTCKWGVLTNGDVEDCGYRDFTTGEIEFGKQVPQCSPSNKDSKSVQLFDTENKLLDENFMKTATVADIEKEIENGADVNAKREGDWTVLIIAAIYNSSSEVISFLVSKGADVNARDKVGWTALMFAVESGLNTRIIEVLIKHGADINAKR